MRTDGQKDMTKLIVAFRNFVNAPEIKLRPLMYLIINEISRGRFGKVATFSLNIK
jgi:hypothetical protein